MDLYHHRLVGLEFVVAHHRANNQARAMRGEKLIVRDLGLFLHRRDSLPKFPPLVNEGHKLERGDYGKSEGVIVQLVRRFRDFFPLMLAIGGICLSLCGVELDDERRILRPTLICGGGLMFLWGLSFAVHF
jgi:hypothetical protein